MLPDATVSDAKLAVEVDPLTDPDLTRTVELGGTGVTPLTLMVRVLGVPAVIPVKRVVYVPGVAVAETVPNDPGRSSACECKAEGSCWPVRRSGLPAASSIRRVSKSVLPEATVGDAKLAVEVDPLTVPTVTRTLGWVLSVTPLTLVVRVLAVPAVIPVKRVVYVPGVAVAETVPNVPEEVPPASVRLKALLASPLIGLPAASLIWRVSRSVLPEATVGDAKPTSELVGLIVSSL